MKTSAMKLSITTIAIATVIAANVAAAQLALDSANVLTQGLTVVGTTTFNYVPVGTAGLRMEFGTGYQPPRVAIATVLVDEGVPNSWFFGNYIERAINTIRFDATGSGYVPAAANLELRCSNGSVSRTWRCDIKNRIPVQAGVTTMIGVSLQVSNWTTPDSSVTNRDATFAKDIQNVTRVSFVFQPGPAGATRTAAQNYTIANVVAVNDDGISSPPASLTALEQDLIARFGYGYGSFDDLTANMKTWDEDGDGIPDYIEIGAEYFLASDINVVSDGAEITWTCIAGESYTVLRADSLTGVLTPVEGLTGIVATQTGSMMRKDTQIAGQKGPFYYRIRLD